MLAQPSRPRSMSFAPAMDRLVDGARAALGFMAKVLFAAFIIVAAGVLAVATAMVGLVIAGFAIVFRMIGNGAINRGRGRSGRHSSASEGPVTLEARRTARGWTVE